MFVYFSCSLVDFVGRSLDMYRVSLYTSLVPRPSSTYIPSSIGAILKVICAGVGFGSGTETSLYTWPPDPIHV